MVSMNVVLMITCVLYVIFNNGKCKIVLIHPLLTVLFILKYLIKTMCLANTGATTDISLAVLVKPDFLKE